MRRNYQIIERKLVESPQSESPLSVFVNPDDAEKKQLVDVAKLDEHTMMSALDPDELSRIEFEPEHVAIIFKRPKNYSSADQYVFGVMSTGVFLFKDHLWIVVANDSSLFDGVAIQKAISLPGILLRLIGRAIVHFREHLRAMSMISDELQSEINKSMENKHLISMFGLQKSLVFYVNAINSNGALLDKLKNNGAKLGFQTEELELADDLIIENNQCYRQAEMYSNILASLMDARASIVANNLNVLMKRLNVITIAIMVPTFVVSAFSMNVPIPLGEWRFAFWMVMVLAITSVFAFLHFWKRRGG